MVSRPVIICLCVFCLPIYRQTFQHAPESLTHLGRVTGAVPRPAAGVAAGRSAVAEGEVVAGCTQ